MLKNLVVIHRLGPKAFPENTSQHWLSWQTCIRGILFGWSQHLGELSLMGQEQIFRAEKAYAFALEVVTGLHSPMVGETEVHGQFKQLLGQVLDPSLAEILRQIDSDAKRIRHQCLRGMGSQSYGSMVRRYLRDFDEVHFLGAGQLVQELLPWVAKSRKKVVVHCRDPQKAAFLAAEWRNVSVVQFGDDLPGEALVVAAPISASQMREDFSLTTKNPLRMVIDLRGTAETDPLNIAPVQVITLQRLFEEIERTRAQVQTQVAKAKADIAKISAERSNSVLVRPFGWDDLCA